MKKILFIMVIMSMFFLCGCGKKCPSCNLKIDEETGKKIDNELYCADCVEYCEHCNAISAKKTSDFITHNGKRYCKECIEYCKGCNVLSVKDSNELIKCNGAKWCKDCIEYCEECKTPYIKSENALLFYKEYKYCNDCFKKIAYPIVLKDDKNFKMEITNYDDNEGLFSIKLTNNTSTDIDVYEQNNSVLLDGNERCIGETDGTHSFSYATVPAHETITVFSSFRKNGDDGWEDILKISDFHTFEFVMTAFSSDLETNNFWDTKFKVNLTPDMFGYKLDK